MAIENVKLTYGHNYQDVVGLITLDQRVEKLLASGQSLILVPTLVEDVQEGMRVVGLTVLPQPLAPTFPVILVNPPHA